MTPASDLRSRKELTQGQSRPTKEKEAISLMRTSGPLVSKFAIGTWNPFAWPKRATGACQRRSQPRYRHFQNEARTTHSIRNQRASRLGQAPPAKACALAKPALCSENRTGGRSISSWLNQASTRSSASLRAGLHSSSNGSAHGNAEIATIPIPPHRAANPDIIRSQRTGRRRCRGNVFVK